MFWRKAMKNRYSLSKLIYSFLFLTCAISVFAQIPPVQNPQEEILTYTPSTDYKEPEYLWGVFDDYKKTYKNNYVLNGVLSADILPFYIEEHGAKEKPTNISDKKLAEKNALENTLNKANREKELSNLITEAFKVWFNDTKKAIKDAHREDEFRDIMPILDKSVKTQRIDKTLADHFNSIKFYFSNEQTMLSNCCSDIMIATKKCEDIQGCANREHKIIYLINPYSTTSYYTKDYAKKVLIHEIGHLYGLTDQYEDFGHSDVTHTTTDRFINGISVMGASLTSSLRCDDVDGFINLIDLTRYLRDKKWSSRAQKGWASFCNGKGGVYHTTYYKEARVLNKKDYRNEGPQGDQCVYTYTAEGKVDKKYCPKLWSFARPKDQLTYGKNGLLTNKKDEKFNYRYSYLVEDKNPTVKVTITNSGYQYTSTRKLLNGKKTWALPSGYFVATRNDKYIQIDKQNCNIVNFIPFSDNKSYSVNLVNDKIQSEYTYSFNLKNQLIDMRKSGSGENRVCTVSWIGSEIVKLEKGFFSKELTDNNKNKTYLTMLEERTNMTRDQLLERLKTECKKDLHQSIIDNSKALCNYFRKVDNYFDR